MKFVTLSFCLSLGFLKKLYRRILYDARPLVQELHPNGAKVEAKRADSEDWGLVLSPRVRTTKAACLRSLLVFGFFVRGVQMGLQRDLYPKNCQNCT